MVFFVCLFVFFVAGCFFVLNKLLCGVLTFFRVLASLNLPAAIEDVSGDSVPQSILQKSKSVIELGGVQTVDQLIKDLPELLQRNREILDEVSFRNK